MKFLLVLFILPIIAVKIVTWADQSVLTSALAKVPFKSELFNKLLEEAVVKGDLNFVETLFSSPKVTYHIKDNCLIRVASSKGQYDIVELLLENGVKRDPLDYAILLAAKIRNSKMIESLVQTSEAITPDKNVVMIYDLVYNCYHGHQGPVQYLLQTVDPTAYNNSALLAALKNHHGNIVEILLNDERVSQSEMSDRILGLLKEFEDGKNVISSGSDSVSQGDSSIGEDEGLWSKLCFWCCKNCKKYGRVTQDAEEDEYQDLSFPILESHSSN